MFCPVQFVWFRTNVSAVKHVLVRLSFRTQWIMGEFSSIHESHRSFQLSHWLTSIITIGLVNVHTMGAVDSSAPTILPPQVRVPSTPGMLFFIVIVLYWSCEENESKQKEAGFGPFKKHLGMVKF